MSTRPCCVVFHVGVDRPRLVAVVTTEMAATAYVAELNKRAADLHETFRKSDLHKSVVAAVRAVHGASSEAFAEALDRRDAIEQDIAHKFTDPEMLALDPGWTFDRHDDEARYYFIRDVPMVIS